MSESVTITSVTANTPVDIYYCTALSASCVYVATVSSFPYTFQVPDPYDNDDYVIKIIDSESCEVGHTIDITPTPTKSATPTPTPTITPTVTVTPSVTITSTVTPTLTITPTITPTITTTPTATPVVAPHAIGSVVSPTSATTCNDGMTVVNYYTYISQAYLTPVIGATVYQTVVGGVLYNPFNGGNNYIKMGWGVDYYVVQINSSGNIMDYVICP